MTLKFELSRDVCTMHLPTKFHLPIFNSSQVIVLTDKHSDRDFVENIHLAPLCYIG